VGPYTVVRTTQRIGVNDDLMVFGLFSEQDLHVSPRVWSKTIAVSSVVVGNPVGGAANTNLFPLEGLGSVGEAFMACPAAITVQIMNPEALQTSQGIVYIGRSSSQYELGGSARTWTDLGEQFVNFMSPRLCSAAKLVLRGVQVSSYPLDMSEISNFRTLRDAAASPFTWGGSTLALAGFAPIVVYNPSGVLLEYLVTVEWRVRFDPGTLAAGSHVQHPMQSEQVWDRVVRTATAVGHGVQDICEKVAQAGEVYAAARGALALTG